MLIVEQIKHVFNELDIPVWISDEHMQVTFFNKAWFRLTGRSFEDECNAGWLLSSPDSERERFINTYVAYFELGEPFEIELKTKDYRGRDCYLLLKGVPLFGTERNCRGYITFAYDQTAKVLVESELQKSELFYRTLFEKSPVGILVVDSEGWILDCNQVALSLNPGQESDFFKNLNVLTDPIFVKSSVSNQFKNCMELRQTISFDAEIDYGVGGRRVFSHRLTPFLVKNECEGVIAFFEDITERKNLEEKNVYDHKMTTLGNLAAAIAHELNSPLGIIRLSCDMLKMGLEEEPEVFKGVDTFVDNIAKSSNRMGSIIKQVMHYAKGDHEIQKSFLDLNQLIQDVLLMYGKMFRVEDVQLVSELDEKLPTFLGSESHMQTIFTDLINFARDNVKTNESEKIIKIKTSFKAELDSLSIVIEDNGPSLPLDMRGRIFEPFFTINSPELGPGLGLSISHSLIKKHGGTIGLECGPHDGNRFCLIFPATSSQEY